MLSEEGATNMFREIHRLWVEPELKKRRDAGVLPSDLKIYRCLIRQPVSGPAVVEFNEEVGFNATVKFYDGETAIEGEPVCAHQIERIEAVQAPELDGKRVSFIFFWLHGSTWRIVFDFTPNHAQMGLDVTPIEWSLGEAIVEHLRYRLTQHAASISDEHKTRLGVIGLWVVPALIPSPIFRLVKLLDEGKTAEATQLLLAHCTPSMLNRLSERWWELPEFQVRRAAILEALEAHAGRKYRLSVYTLLPQVEGIITDWLHAQVPEMEIPWRAESKTKKFRDVLTLKGLAYVETKVADSMLRFILEGPVFRTFKKWSDTVSTAFPPRHVVEHGKYEESLFSEENSIKLILLLDTLFVLLTKCGRL